MLSFRDRLNRKQKKEFVGREAQLSFFKTQLAAEEPDCLIFFTRGIGGVGKSTLLGQWIRHAEAQGWVVAKMDDGQKKVEALMEKCRDDLVQQGYTLPVFDKSYEQFRRLRSEAEKALVEWDTQKEGDFARSMGRLTGKSVAAVAELFTPTKAIMELAGGKEFVAEGFAESFAYIRRRARNAEDLAYLENPLRHLTRALVQDLNKIAGKIPLLLCFDSYEFLAEFCDTWFCMMLLNEDISGNIRFALAGRRPLSSAWLDYQGVCTELHLESFSNNEARHYLDLKGFTDQRTVEDILRISNCLPLYLALFSTQQSSQAPDALHDPNLAVVECFLKWIPDETTRQVVIRMAILREFNRDSLQAMLGEEFSPDECAEMFVSLQQRPFVRKVGEFWRYHREVREPLLRHQRAISPEEYKRLNRQALQYYQGLPRMESLELQLYHWLVIDKQRGIDLALEERLARWLEEKPKREWETRVGYIAEQVDRELDGKGGRQQRWEENLEYYYGSDKKAKQLFERLAHIDYFIPSAKSSAWLNLGGLLKKDGHIEAAERAYREAINIKPDDAWSYRSLGTLLHEQERFDDAEVAFRQAIDLNPDLSWVYCDLGILLGKQERFVEAEAVFKKSLELKPDSAWFYRNYGVFLNNRGRVEEAERAYREAIALKPDYSKAYVNLACLLEKQGRCDEAQTVFVNAIQLKPGDPYAYQHLGCMLLQQKCFVDAADVFRQAIAIVPDAVWPHFNLADALRQQGCLSEAVQSYRMAVSVNPTNAESVVAREHLAALYLEQANWQNAIWHYRWLLALNKHAKHTQFKLALVFACQGDSERAEKEYQRALRNSDRQSIEQATADLRHAINKYPQNTALHTFLHRVQHHR